MTNPTKSEWPKKVEFQLCPNCRRHANIVIDGVEDNEDIISLEGAIVKVVSLLKQRRISYAQARGLAPAIADSRLIPLQSDAEKLINRQRELIKGFFGGDAVAALFATARFGGGDQSESGSPSRH